jgi:hypothetical protein
MVGAGHVIRNQQLPEAASFKYSSNKGTQIECGVNTSSPELDYVASL